MKKDNHIVILVGVCGIGKRAVGEKVAQKLDVPFFDVDKLDISESPTNDKLPQEINIDKWLVHVEDLILNQLALKGCVISCSILKKIHRKKLTANIDHVLDWVFMNDSYENVTQRVEEGRSLERPVSLLKSDFETLEIPKRALTIDMMYSEQEIVNIILKYLARKYG